MKTINLLAAGSVLWLAGAAPVLADWTKYLDTIQGAADTAGVSTNDVDLTNTEMVTGLKEAVFLITKRYVSPCRTA